MFYGDTFSIRSSSKIVHVFHTNYDCYMQWLCHDCEVEITHIESKKNQDGRSKGDSRVRSHLYYIVRLK